MFDTADTLEGRAATCRKLEKLSGLAPWGWQQPRGDEEAGEYRAKLFDDLHIKLTFARDWWFAWITSEGDSRYGFVKTTAKIHTIDVTTGNPIPVQGFSAVDALRLALEGLEVRGFFVSEHRAKLARWNTQELSTHKREQDHAD